MKHQLTLVRLQSSDADFSEQLDNRLAVADEQDAELTQTVSTILSEVRQRGNDALLEYTNRFDRRQASINDIEVSVEDMHAALEEIPAEMRKQLEYAAQRIRSYHEHQLTESWSYHDEEGTLLGQKVTPLERVGVYVPGGKAAYPSSVLMNTIPAQVAGVEQIIMVVPAPDDILNPLVLAAASIAGVSRAFSVGGAQAIAALAYGTDSVPAVDKIVGPGNRYVAAAKRMVFGTVGIDMIAGPSEVLIISDGTGNPDWLAMDMFAQAEHDEDARAILLCTELSFIKEVQNSINKLLPEMERKEIISKSLSNNGSLIKVKDLDEAAEVANYIAAEHLELAVAEPEKLLDQIHHAGAIFMGHFTAEVFGDYCAGPNHVLPTARTARFSSPLGVYDFQKRSSLIMCSESSAANLASSASVLARGEGLSAHARSAELRKKT
ncbi:MAG: histidinol dehydrogenase [Gammaproteobacteria bacterium]|jgi:histidinol dehydrogenase|nr:histidinol dehydrogenase [Gammaproteobacteria bacterium]